MAAGTAAVATAAGGHCTIVEAEGKVAFLIGIELGPVGGEPGRGLKPNGSLPRSC